jgi:hypothetical protein
MADACEPCQVPKIPLWSTVLIVALAAFVIFSVIYSVYTLSRRGECLE